MVFESRRAPEMARLVERAGAEAIVAPTMQEIPLEAGPEVRAFAERLRMQLVDIVFLLTGVGTRVLANVLESSGVMPRRELAAALSRTKVAARGPKTVAVLKELGVRGYLVAPEPHTWRELFDAAATAWPLHGAHVAVQLYGAPHPELMQALAGAGATVSEVPVYRWQLPDDLAPAERAIDALLGGGIDAALFTSAQQIDNLLAIAERRGQREALFAALGRTTIGSIGPTCTERLVSQGLVPAVQPEHGHMGHLVRAVAVYISSQRGIE